MITISNKLILIVLALFFTAASFAQSGSDILMSVGGENVTVDEFKYIYEKNNGGSADYSEKSVREYLDLYKKFKLKVAKAKDMKLDTVPDLQKELEGYRRQLANSFLTDKEVVDKLIDEIHERKKQDVKISHILVKTSPKAPEKQNLAALKKIENFKSQLENGKTFESVARQFSEDRNTKTKGGSLGYITAPLPSGFYDLENAAYNAKIGEVTGPIKTKMGYHLIRVENRRPARGMVEVAHLFRRVDKTDKVEMKQVDALMDSIYNELTNGADFNAAVKKYSEDKTTVDKGGKMPPFGIGVYDIKFEDAAFALANDGDFSKPFHTSSGMHILKRISKSKTRSKEQLRATYKDRLKKLQRYELATDAMIEKVKANSKFTEKPNTLNRFIKSLDEEFYTYKWKPDPNMDGGMLLAFGDEHQYTLMDFAIFAKRQTRMRSQYDKDKPLKEAVADIYNAFVKEKAYDYEQENLEVKYPEFKSLMREYEEGILLFEATKINVWDKANQDTLGLYQYYENNKSKYFFEKQAEISKYIVNTSDEKVLKKIKKCAKRKSPEKVLKKYNKDGKELVEHSTVTVEPGSKELVGLLFKKKSISEPVVDKKNNKAAFKKVEKILPSRRKSLKEARGYVVADYQDELEKEWVRKLKKTYPIKIDESILNSLIK